MGRRKKSSNENVTKIDPRTLALRLHAVSQHAANDGTRVTTALKPILRPPAQTAPSDFKHAPNTSSFDDEYLEDDGEIDDPSRGYYVAWVCGIPSHSLRTNSSKLGQPFPPNER